MLQSILEQTVQPSGRPWREALAQAICDCLMDGSPEGFSVVEKIMKLVKNLGGNDDESSAADPDDTDAGDSEPSSSAGLEPLAKMESRNPFGRHGVERMQNISRLLTALKIENRRRGGKDAPRSTGTSLLESEPVNEDSYRAGLQFLTGRRTLLEDRR